MTTEIKYYLRPIGLINNSEGKLLAKEDKVLLIKGVYFSNIEVLTRKNKKVVEKKVYSVKEFLEKFKKNKKFEQSFNRLFLKNKKLEKLLYNDRGYSIFGILNLTPDSFSDGGENLLLKKANNNAQKMIDNGAMFIDVGGESTRPGAEQVTPEKEISRIMPIIQILSQKKINISLDTRNSSTMELGILSGVKVINDVSALSHDQRSVDIIKKYNCPVVIMHMPGTPKTMMKKNKYFNVILDVFDYLEHRIISCENIGIKRENIIVDPGIGFGKDYKQNLEIIKNISIFHSLGCYIMLGVSRKKFIDVISSEPDPKKRIGGTISATLFALQHGIRIHRVHDVKDINQAIMLFQKLIN